MSDVSVVNSVQGEKGNQSVSRKLPEVNTDLSLSQQQELLQLLTTFSTLFATPENPLGKTNVVKHSIHTIVVLPYDNP